MKNRELLIKVVLAILMFLCLLDMPYGFYQFVRFLALIGFVILAYQANKEQKQTQMIIYGGLALLFQPFFKIALGREMWNIVDVIVGIGLIGNLIIKKLICNKIKTRFQYGNGVVSQSKKLNNESS